MPARSCQCPERRAPIASRRWEVCSKPGDGTTVIRCKACGAIWTTRAKFADTMPYDIGHGDAAARCFPAHARHRGSDHAGCSALPVPPPGRRSAQSPAPPRRNAGNHRSLREPHPQTQDFGRRTTRPPCGLRCYVPELPLSGRPLEEGRPLGRPVLRCGLDDLRRRRPVPELHQHAGLVEAAQAVRQMGHGNDGNVPRMRRGRG